MLVLVTGALGFIGSNLCSKLLNDGHKVLAFDNRSNESLGATDRIKRESGENWKNFLFFQADVQDLHGMLSICANYQPQAIVHLAAVGSVPRSFETPELYVHTNEIGFLNVMYMSQAFQVKKFIYASSSSVYGDADGGLRIEGNEGQCLSPYALSKKHNEEIARMWKGLYGANSIGLRFFNVYGPGQLFDSNYSAVIPRWLSAEKIHVNGDGSVVRDFTFVGDVCEAICGCLQSTERHFIANVGTGVGTTLKELALAVSAGKKEILYGEPRAGDIHTSVASTDNLKSKVGYRPATALLVGLEKTREFYEGHKAR